jgi:hypothetical protein
MKTDGTFWNDYRCLYHRLLNLLYPQTRVTHLWKFGRVTDDLLLTILVED